MKIFLLFYMCDFAVGLTHCYKTTVFLHLLQYNAILHTAAITIMLQICPVSNIMTDLQYNKFCYVLNGTMRNRRKFSHSGDFDDNSSTYGCNTEPT